MQIIFCFNSKKTVKVKVQMQWPGFKSDLWPFVVCLSAFCLSSLFNKGKKFKSTDTGVSDKLILVFVNIVYCSALQSSQHHRTVHLNGAETGDLVMSVLNHATYKICDGLIWYFKFILVCYPSKVT